MDKKDEANWHKWKNNRSYDRRRGKKNQFINTFGFGKNYPMIKPEVLCQILLNTPAVHCRKLR